MRRDPHREDHVDSGSLVDHDGHVTLTSTHTPVRMVLLGLFFTLFWNGIVSIFVYNVVKSYLDGRPEICLTIFLIPFVLIGLGLILFFIALSWTYVAIQR